MASEDQDILAKITHLRGQINQHKTGQPVDQATTFHQTTRSQTFPSAGSFDFNQRAPANPYPPTNLGYSRGGYATRRSPSRGRARGRGAAPIHRHRTLILNGNATADSTSASSDAGTSTPPTAGQTWISKTDRHMQLINPSIFEKDSQRRAKAIEETRQQKLKQRDEREKNKLSKHLHRVAGKPYTPGPSSYTGNYEVDVQGIRFRVVKSGGKLVKVPGEGSQMINGQHTATPTNVNVCLPFAGDLNAAKATPKTALIGGVKFHRSTNGNMYRAGIIKAHRYGWQILKIRHFGPRDTADKFQSRRTAGIKKIDEPCKIFSTTGSCPKGPRCRYVHDPSKVAVCKEFLQKGSCPSGDSCDLSHELTPERTPACLHFSKGNCSNSNCRYTHVRVSPTALVCRSFAIYGYCEKASSCIEKHIHECPDFSNTGSCSIKGCKLPHRHKASVMRNGLTTGNPVVDGEDSDISSDEEDEEIDSDDLDSDEFDEELFGHDEEADPDISAQKDFVQLQSS